MNLISNIGFDSEATNYTDESSTNSKIRTSSINFPLVHPDVIEINPEFDKELFEMIFFVPFHRKLHLAVVKRLKKLKFFFNL